MVKAVLQLETLTCPSCIKKIETVLNKTPGICSTNVLFNFSKVKTEFNETEITITQIQEIIEKLGYDILSTKVS